MKVKVLGGEGVRHVLGTEQSPPPWQENIEEGAEELKRQLESGQGPHHLALLLHVKGCLWGFPRNSRSLSKSVS